VQLDRRKAQVRGNVRVLDLNGFFNSHAFQNFSGVRATGNGRPTAEGLKHGFFDSTVLFVNLDLELHYVTTSGGTYEASAYERGVFVERANVSGVGIVVQHVFMVSESSSSLDTHEVKFEGICGCHKRPQH